MEQAANPFQHIRVGVGLAICTCWVLWWIQLGVPAVLSIGSRASASLSTAFVGAGAMLLAGSIFTAILSPLFGAGFAELARRAIRKEDFHSIPWSPRSASRLLFERTESANARWFLATALLGAILFGVIERWKLPLYPGLVSSETIRFQRFAGMAFWLLHCMAVYQQLRRGMAVGIALRIAGGEFRRRLLGAVMLEVMLQLLAGGVLLMRLGCGRFQTPGLFLMFAQDAELAWGIPLLLLGLIMMAGWSLWQQRRINAAHQLAKAEW